MGRKEWGPSGASYGLSRGLLWDPEYTLYHVRDPHML